MNNGFMLTNAYFLAIEALAGLLCDVRLEHTYRPIAQKVDRVEANDSGKVECHPIAFFIPQKLGRDRMETGGHSVDFEKLDDEEHSNADQGDSAEGCENEAEGCHLVAPAVGEKSPAPLGDTGSSYTTSPKRARQNERRTDRRSGDDRGGAAAANQHRDRRVIGRSHIGCVCAGVSMREARASQGGDCRGAKDRNRAVSCDLAQTRFPYTTSHSFSLRNPIAAAAAGFGSIQRYEAISSTRSRRGSEFGCGVGQHVLVPHFAASECVQLSHSPLGNAAAPLGNCTSEHAKMFGGSFCATFFSVKPSGEFHATSLDVAKPLVKSLLNLIAVNLAVA